MKRKAAKKKKENNHSHIAPNPSSASTHYSLDDVKHQDDKHSDAGEVSSPASPDHQNHQNVLTERDSEETKNEESAVQIEREFKIGDESIKKDGKIKQDESRKSYNEGSYRSSSSYRASSSDGESRGHGITNTLAVEDSSPIDDSMKAADHLSESNVLVVKKPMVDDEIASFVEKAEVNENEEQNVSSIGISDPKECEVQEIDNRYDASNVPVDNEKDSVTQTLLERPVQTTSWKRCCGLCELFTGSAR